MAAPAPRDAKRARPAALEARVSTTELPGLGTVCSVLAVKGGELLLGTRTALYLQVHGRLALIAGHPSKTGFKDGQGVEARFNVIRGLALERDGSVLVCDGGNHSVRRVSPHGQVTTVAGNGKEGFADGVGAAARFNWPYGIEVDRQGLIYVADCCNDSVRKVALPDGRVTTVAGSVEGGWAGAGYADGTGTAARFNRPSAVAVDGSNAILVADRYNNRVRKISGEGGVVTTVAGHGEAGKVDGTGPNARFNDPWKLTIDEEGHLVVAEVENDDSLRVVEASLVPPARLAARETAGEQALRAASTGLCAKKRCPPTANVTSARAGSSSSFP